MEYGDKLILKENKDIAEIIGVYPAGQGIRIESAEKYYSVMISGHQAYLPNSLVNHLMAKYEAKPIVQEATVSEVIEQTVKASAPKKKTKKVK
jgi:hypothetical protein